jgi:hypothetical protein
LVSSSNAANLVGAEYTIEEKASGKLLGTLWFQLSKESKMGIMLEFVDFEKRLISVSFPKHGCIYFSTDLEHRRFKTEKLTKGLTFQMSLPEDFDCSILSLFTPGPLTQAKLWQSERGKLSLARGPRKNLFYKTTTIS